MRTAIFALAAVLYGSLLAAAPSIPPQADVSVGGVVLHDLASQTNVLGTSIPFDKNADLPAATFGSSDGTQFLTVITHPGGVGEISEFRVAYSAGTAPVVRRISKIKRFVTGKGIELGLSKARLVSRLGEPARQTVHGRTTVLQYRIEDTKQNPSEFLSSYNMPAYYGTYSFRNNRLVSFQWGLEYP